MPSMQMLLLGVGGTPPVETAFDNSTRYTNSPTTAGSLSNSNRTFTATSGGDDTGVFGDMARSSGKYYLEFLIGTQGAGNGLAIGVANSTSMSGAPYNYLGALTGQVGYYTKSGQVYTNNAAAATIMTNAVANDVICMAVDVGNKKVWWRINNGNWNNNGANDPATNTGGLAPTTTTGSWYVAVDCNTSAVVTLRTSSQWTLSPPSGFGAWV